METNRLNVDFASRNGTIRPLHGGNNGPMVFGDTIDLSTYHRELGVPVTRLHDANWPTGDVVDIRVIFPDFSADPEDPLSYDFRRTDDYLKSIVEVGSQIVYRLGASIEHTQRKMHIHPPDDFEKWAEVCVHIIMHYNEGWADGFHYNIRYWEVWNEPEGDNMWTGSSEQFCELYVTAAKRIKQYDDSLCVGGPAACRLKEPTFLYQFFSACRDQAAPLDFFSWHVYGQSPDDFKGYALQMRELLDQYGFTDTESHLNEWNYCTGFGDLWSDQEYTTRMFEHANGPAGAAFIASSLLLFQDLPIDVANFYTYDLQPWSVFGPLGLPLKSFYGVKVFAELLTTPHRVETVGSVHEHGLEICAGVSDDKRRANIVISNFDSDACEFQLELNESPFGTDAWYEIFEVSATRDMAPVGRGKIPASNTIRLRCQRQSIKLIRMLQEWNDPGDDE